MSQLCFLFLATSQGNVCTPIRRSGYSFKAHCLSFYRILAVESKSNGSCNHLLTLFLITSLNRMYLTLCHLTNARFDCGLCTANCRVFSLGSTVCLLSFARAFGSGRDLCQFVTAPVRSAMRDECTDVVDVGLGIGSGSAFVYKHAHAHTHTNTQLRCNILSPRGARE